MLPGMHDKNSKPDKEFFEAKSESFLSGVAAPTSISLFLSSFV